MSGAGKFIPGGAGRKTTGVGGPAVRTGPIRAPVEPPAGTPQTRLFSKGAGLVKPVPKNRRFPITLMSAGVSILLFLAAYEFAYLPEVRSANEANLRALNAQKQLEDERIAMQKAKEDLAKQQSNVLATLTINTIPPGATVIIGGEHKLAPATFNNLNLGKVTLLVQAEGYADYRQELTLTDKTTDLGTITLVRKTGGLALTSSEPGVSYTLTGPDNYSHEGQLPDHLTSLAVGDYQVVAANRDWKLPPITISIHDQETVTKEIQFPYATLAIESTPPGATVRQGRAVLGRTPLSLNHLKPGNMHLSVDLPPFTFQRLDVVLPPDGTITRRVTLVRDRDFVSGSGIAMVWVPEGGYWVGKYPVRQAEFETVAGINPSAFRKPNRPVESINWDGAMAFCEKLNQYERRTGHLPNGYHYTLPTESQWSLFMADADIDQAAMSRSTSLASTQDVGASEPNKYGLYDTLGNVWEWCLDQYDAPGTHSLRGGGWLSSADNFPSSDTRIGASASYADRFSGFRVILVPQ